MSGRFTPQFLDEIRARLTVSDVVGRRVSLKKQGREWAGLSPFNAEKTPSFFVNDQKGFYHCFSSGKHGDQFGFLMETEGLSFPEAVERLANEAGLELPKADPREAKRAQERKPLYEIVEIACSFFERELRGQRGASARRALTERGIDGKLASRFRIGFAPNSRSALKEHLGAKGVSEREMAEAGLVIAGEDIETPYDRFRDRIVFPITDTKSRVIAFGGRAMGEAKAKYLNSPETELFHKGSTLYNGATARRAAHEADRIVCVEGYVDVIACARAGIDEAVAPLGTALTENQLRLLWRAAPEPILCFDGDKAGRRAADRVIDIALPDLAPGRSLRFVFLPDGLDPDDMVRARGPEALREALNETRPLADVLWDRETGQRPVDTPERRAALDARLKTLLGTIRDPDVRKHYQTDARERLYQLYRSKRQQGGKPQARRRGGKNGGKDGGTGAVAVPDAERRALLEARNREGVLLALLVNHPPLLDAHAEEIADLPFTRPEFAELRDGLLSLADDDIPAEKLIARHADSLARADRLARRMGIWQATPGADPREAEAVLQQLLHRQRQERLQQNVEDAWRAFRSEDDERAWAWLQKASEERTRREHEDAELQGGRDSARSLDDVIGNVRRRLADSARSRKR